jgi:hypothetical protein
VGPRIHLHGSLHGLPGHVTSVDLDRGALGHELDPDVGRDLLEIRDGLLDEPDVLLGERRSGHERDEEHGRDRYPHPKTSHS